MRSAPAGGNAKAVEVRRDGAVVVRAAARSGAEIAHFVSSQRLRLTVRARARALSRRHI